LADQTIAHGPSRRSLLRLGAATAAASLLPQASGAQESAEVAADGFRIIRARGREPGPALNYKRGEEVRVRLINEMQEPAAIHWHGIRIANAMGGVPGLTQDAVPPGGQFDYRFVLPDAGTYWYRAPVAANGKRLAGPYGILQVAEREPVAVERERTLLIDRWPEPGSVRGVAMVPNNRLRLRLINALDGLLQLRLERIDATVVAIDGQPAEPFRVQEGQIALGPGNRIDLFIDITDTGREPAELWADDDGTKRTLLTLQGNVRPLLRALPLPFPAPLPANGLPQRMDFRGAMRAEVPLAGNPAPLPSAPHFTVRRGRTVMLAITNPTAGWKSLYIHGHAMRLLDRLDDGWKPFWLNTTLAGPQDTVRVAFVADNPGRWLLEGANVWFQVT